MDFAEKSWLLLKYLFLGVFQGFTEPIPISSSGHLVILRHLMNVNIEGLSFEILVNFGSLIAVLIIYRHDIIQFIQNSIKYLFQRDKNGQADFRFLVYLVVGTVPAGVLGILFEDWISETFKSVKMVGITLIITGIALWVIRNLRGYKNDADITFKDAILIGLAQAVALMPGISRSGATIVAAMLFGLKQETALRFSFLLYIPVSAGSLLLSISDIANDGNLSVLWLPYLLALIGSIVASYYALIWFMNMMARGNLKYFAFYCLIVGAIVFAIF